MFLPAPANWRSQHWGKAFSYYTKNGGGKSGRYIDCGASSDVFSGHHGTRFSKFPTVFCENANLGLYRAKRSLGMEIFFMN
jgi:hypothetical protein